MQTYRFAARATAFALLASVALTPSARAADAAPAYVDAGASNQRGDACLATPETNAGVRVLSGFLKVWTPVTPFVDADQAAPAKDGCPAVAKSPWSGVPGQAPDGTVVNKAVHDANIGYVAKVTQARTPDETRDAYLDDRRGKNVSIVDGLGPLADAWRKGARQTTTITDVPADATTKKYDDKGNNRGVAGDANPDLGKSVAFIEALSADGSTEPAKRYFKYARPYRWSDAVIVAPPLVPAKSTNPASDGGFPSGHTAEAWRDSLALAYLVPQRFQAMLARASQMGENRILAGMHSPLDVIGGRIQATAVVAYNLNHARNADLKRAAFTEAQAFLQRETGAASAAALATVALSAPAGTDPYADRAAQQPAFTRRLTYDLPAVGPTETAPRVPKGAEVLLETRLPYLTAEQRRAVLASTEIAGGRPLTDDAEGWGRLNLFAAADGYAAFDGAVTVEMDAAAGGFAAADVWRNDIAGAGSLVKRGSGALLLTGRNSFAGGTRLEAGTLAAASAGAFGTGPLTVAGGTLHLRAPVEVAAYSQAAAGALTLPLGVATLTVASEAALDGTLRLTVPAEAKLAAGATVPVLKAAKLNGRFANVELAGRKATPVYGATTLSLRLDD